MVKTVALSSTLIDLPEHRSKVIDCCLRLGFMPNAMENFSASIKSPIEASLNLVDQSDIYLLIIGLRYGDIVLDYQKSITEIEYDRAYSRKIPILVFICSDDHNFPAKYLFSITEDSKHRRKEFIEKIISNKINGSVIKEFDSVESLDKEVTYALALMPQVETNESKSQYNLKTIPDILTPFIPHPYYLLNNQDFVGRIDELKSLDLWINSDNAISSKPIFSFIAIGGMGKSALTWHWFNSRIKNENLNFQGKIWWSFYETDSSFGNFIAQAICYFKGVSIKQVEKLSDSDREATLLFELKNNKHFIVFDGMERILKAYSSLDAAKLSEDKIDEETGNILLSKSFDIGNASLRKPIDIRVHLFLLKLVDPSIKSKILITSRLHLNSFEDKQNIPFSSCLVYALKGLDDSSSLALWRSLKVSGSDENILKICNSFANYPLLIRALAAEISKYRRNPGNLYEWLKENSDFSPFLKDDLVQVKTHILTFSLKGIEKNSFEVLKRIAAFRSQVEYSVLRGLLLGSDKIFEDEYEFHASLQDIEDRGLVGWNRLQNKYDMHPIVRGVIWTLTENKKNIFQSMETHFSAIPINQDWKNVESEDDLSFFIEFYYILIQQEKYFTAYSLYYDRLKDPINYKLNNNYLNINLLESLNLDTFDDHFTKIVVYNLLGISNDCVGKLESAIQYYQKSLEIVKNNIVRHRQNSAITMSNISVSYLNKGDLLRAEYYCCEALNNIQGKAYLIDEAIILYKLSIIYYYKGDLTRANKSLNRSLYFFSTQPHYIQALALCFKVKIRRKDSGLSLSKNIQKIDLDIFEKSKKMIRNLSHERSRVIIERSEIEYILSNEETSQLELNNCQNRLNKLLESVRKDKFLEEELFIIYLLAKIDYKAELFYSSVKKLDELIILADNNYIFQICYANNLMAKVYLKTDKTNEARMYLLKTISLLSSKYEVFNNNELYIEARNILLSKFNEKIKHMETLHTKKVPYVDLDLPLHRKK